MPFLFIVFSSPGWADSVVEGTRVEIVMSYGNRDLTRPHQLEDELDIAAR
ncbi:hypothetical protein P0D69_32055 [Paraburkholderia sediminicola]